MVSIGRVTGADGADDAGRDEQHPDGSGDVAEPGWHRVDGGVAMDPEVHGVADILRRAAEVDLGGVLTLVVGLSGLSR
jgi:hypothetical protein